MRRPLLILSLFALVCVTWGLLWLTGTLSRPPPYVGHAGQAALGAPAPMMAAAPAGPSAAPRFCDTPPELTEAAASNASSLTGAQWAVFGRSETGWRTYVPLISKELATSCAPDRRGFARSLQTWQGAHGLSFTGVMTADTLRAMNLVWLGRRPFIAATRNGSCPPPPPDDMLVSARAEEGRFGKAVRLQVDALAAYRQLVAAARAATSDLSAHPQLLTIVSGFRGPGEEAARCAAPGSCGTVNMARCSAHRTGLALDLFLGPNDDSASTSTDDASRELQSRSAAYLWLVANADRFGFTPYPFEPWHWEYTRPRSTGAQAPRR